MNRKYFVVGASSGIGRQIYNNLKLEGNEVYGSYFKNDLSDTRTKYLNVLDSEYSLEFLPESLDGLIYCPGSINLKPFHRIKAESFVDDFRLQVLGAIKIIQQLLPNLKKGNKPSILLFSTVAVQHGFNFHSQVAVSKGAIEGLTKSLAAELSPTIRVNCIAPSLTKTALSEKLINTEEKITTNANRHPLKRIGETEDIAHAAQFLLSEKSSWITGQIIGVDGGLSQIKN